MGNALNSFQRACALTYGQGDYGYLTDEKASDYDLLRKEFDTVADGLFTFLMVELSDREDCESRTVALQRLRHARDDIQEVIDTIESMELDASELAEVEA